MRWTLEVTLLVDLLSCCSRLARLKDRAIVTPEHARTETEGVQGAIAISSYITMFDSRGLAGNTKPKQAKQAPANSTAMKASPMEIAAAQQRPARTAPRRS
jgi:hypothetical protein